MELVFIGPVLLPITPAKIEEVTPGANESVRLINDGEINIRHSPGLKTYTFDVLLPTSQSYPFQIYSMAGLEATAFKLYFEQLHTRKLPFPFIQITWSNNLLANVVGALNVAFSNTLCTIEEMTDLRDAENGQDKIISLSLKEYKDYGTKYVKEAGTDSNGNTLYRVAYQTSSYSYIAELNKLASEITEKLGAAGAMAVSAFKLASNTVSDPKGQAQKAYTASKEFLGW